ncbi:MAG TPA: NAD(P)H-hydrate dehydratase [Limnobacter sp.]|nr:NAD(P)H-hydrate dehydratase [Limnobacter sp.]
MPTNMPACTIDLTEDRLAHGQWHAPGDTRLPVLTVAQIRTVEIAAFAQLDSFVLMRAAGLRTAHKLLDHLAHSAPHTPSVIVLAGPGNNGGDAYMVAGALHKAGLQVQLIDFAATSQGSSDRQRAAQWCAEQGVSAREANSTSLPDTLPAHTVVVDGLLGIAGGRPLEGEMKRWVEHLGSMRSTHALQVLALDCPSGLNCDTGEMQGPCLQAHFTFTYIALKPGLLTNEGKGLAGQVWVDALGCERLIASKAVQQTLGQYAETASRNCHMQRLPKRAHQHHKGSFGSLAVIGGQHGMVGACVLAARTALYLGAGRVALSLLAEQDQQLPDVQLQGQTPFMDLLCPEVMNKPLHENLDFADTAILGPGLGQSESALHMLHTVLSQPKGLHMVWDADALNLLALYPSLAEALQKYRAKHPAYALVLTPHPLEAARLLKCSIADVQADRLASARKLSENYQASVVLKGAGTVVCKQSHCEINLSGGPALGTAGSGDVLAGAIGALLGQGLSEMDAAALGVHVHGLSIGAMPGEREGLMISHASEIALRMKNYLNHLLHQGTR